MPLHRLFTAVLAPALSLAIALAIAFHPTEAAA